MELLSAINGVVWGPLGVGLLAAAGAALMLLVGAALYGLTRLAGARRVTA